MYSVAMIASDLDAPRRPSSGIDQLIEGWTFRVAPFGLFGKAERPLHSRATRCEPSWLEIEKKCEGGRIPRRATQARHRCRAMHEDSSMRTASPLPCSGIGKSSLCAARIHWQRPQSTGKLKPICPSGVPFHDHSVGTQGEPVAALLTSGKGDALLDCCEGNHQDNGRAERKLPIAAPN